MVGGELHNINGTWEIDSELLPLVLEHKANLAKARENMSDEYDPYASALRVIMANRERYLGMSGLKQLKDSQGLTTRIVRVAEIATAYEGLALQEKIRNFIRDAYLQQREYFVNEGKVEDAFRRGKDMLTRCD